MHKAVTMSCISLILSFPSCCRVLTQLRGANPSIINGAQPLRDALPCGAWRRLGAVCGVHLLRRGYTGIISHHLVVKANLRAPAGNKTISMQQQHFGQPCPSGALIHLVLLITTPEQ